MRSKEAILGLRLAASLAVVLGALPIAALAQTETPKPVSMDELLRLVSEGFRLEQTEHRKREQEFRDAQADQARLLEEAEASLEREVIRSQELEAFYNENETEIAAEGERLTERLGQLGELFGVVRLVSTDASGQVWDSLISSQIAARTDVLDRLGRSKELPSTRDLEALWFELQREIVEQGRVPRYRALVHTLDGEAVEREVIRAGPFAAISEGKFLLWDSRDQTLRELPRQPPSRYLSTVAPFERTLSGFADLAVDPSRGSLLNALTDTPDFWERIQQGGYVGFVIIALGVVAVIVGLIRWVVIANTGRKVTAQHKLERADPSNPLGRLLRVYEENRDMDVETLELKLDEVVLRESAKLSRFLWVVKVVSVVAPLLGLLGTVTGMIQTFQAITLFGAGDPKMMAGGISEALVTTMLGLTTAIPLVLLHAALSNSQERIVEQIDEQSAGLIARRAESAIA